MRNPFYFEANGLDSCEGFHQNKKQFITFYIFFIEYANNNNNDNDNDNNDNNTVLINSLKGFSAYFTIL